ncbi:RHS repeat-associated core domain-containing protein [Sorangium sp. So ce1099]|uniref:RHS repeat-associated core domain-containing protein n=1 Tax=Sorangium sp. So ce1099 TaxID=3133331 RepID=UPI003F630B76
MARPGAPGEVEYFVYSPSGSPAALVRGDGTVITRFETSLFGRVSEEAARRTALRAPGQYEDEETGLYYNRYRYYDPETGCYLSPEPIGLAGSLKLYAYVDNYPVDAVDPWGLNPIQTVLTRTDGSQVSAFSGQAQGVAPPNYRPGNPANAQALHPAVAAALPPNNARMPGVGGAPSACGEPLALSRHLYDWERRNKPNRCNPPDTSWQRNLQGALGEVQGIGSNADRGRGGPLNACPNCGQTIPRLWALAGLPPPNGVYQGGVDNPANPAWNPAANQGQNASTAAFNDPGTGAPINPGAYTFSGGGWVRQ